MNKSISGFSKLNNNKRSIGCWKTLRKTRPWPRRISIPGSTLTSGCSGCSTASPKCSGQLCPALLHCAEFFDQWPHLCRADGDRRKQCSGCRQQRRQILGGTRRLSCRSGGYRNGPDPLPLGLPDSPLTILVSGFEKPTPLRCCGVDGQYGTSGRRYPGGRAAGCTSLEILIIIQIRLPSKLCSTGQFYPTRCWNVLPGAWRTF